MSDAFDEMKKMKNGEYSTSAHTEEKASQPVYYVKLDENNIKNFILNWGRKIVDLGAFLGILLTITVFTLFFVYFINSLFDNNGYYGNATSFIAFLFMIFVPLIILIITVVSNYFIYLLIDIRDSLKEINTNLPLKK